ncbi:MAG: UDP-3-O-acyl-N-acetylglucosamine deacetylase [Candidatus Poribacteria bacterium]|nr:UDP-3-O-acyl-N-acetylglucosamine deacetylase [Candidatus Poribacteria bacterium]
MAKADSQQTIQNEITMTGIGLMLGEPVTLTLKPAPADSGIVFRRVDMEGKPEVEVCPENWADILPRCTSLRSGDTTVSSVEHLLSALGGLGVDNVIVELDAPEPPGLDGSAVPYVENIQATGLVSQDVPRNFIEITEPFALSEGDRQLVLLPADALEVTFVYAHPQTTPQVVTFKITPESYAHDIAPARSFCFENEIEALQALGIGKGASYDNVLVINEAGDPSTPLRFEDEFVRHKILDLIGDLYLAGHLPKAHVMATRTGHTFHAEFVRALAEAGHLQQPLVQEPIEVMDIYDVLPHRHPMCMVDRVIEYESKKRAVGIKNVTYNEPIFEGHFPTQPVMPGVLQIEALAQLAAWLVLRDIGKEGELGYFRSISKATFRRAVIPGDQLRLEIEVAQLRSRLARIEGRVYVGDELATEAELSIVLASV